MPLGADDEQAAGGTDLFGLAGHGRLMRCQRLAIGGAGGENVGVVRLGIGVALGQQGLVHAAAAQVILG